MRGKEMNLFYEQKERKVVVSLTNNPGSDT